ncbi:hypothetical protein [Hoeflea ulvae]|uniref:Curlin n=1 Tax=Hoeflea ulvae TaxID=2983764 RepID=A0ABT3YED5_9HYPH|nr:hypothetical protein [Hoeflea ulvae]MCY0094037.1 hypothetical protein [Hoeflea ulvae]
MKLKIVLSTATALGLIAGLTAAYAGNSTAVNQNGTDNSAMVLQDGDLNRAGTSAYGVGQYDIYQNGNDNTLSITQRGNGNGIGTNNSLYYNVGFATPTDRRPASTSFRTQLGGNPYGHGVDQYGSFNALTVTQVEGSSYSDGNAIGTVQQNAALSATVTTNALTITQDNGDGGALAPVAYPGPQTYNYVGQVWQDNTGAGTSLSETNTAVIAQHTLGANGYDHGNRVDFLTQVGTGNNTNILQLGLDHVINETEQDGANNAADFDQTGTNNWIGTAHQFGSFNYAKVEQNGSGNELVSLSQDNGAGSIGNSATLIFNGNDNGTGSFTGDALAVGLTEATVVQLGDDNMLTYTVTGDTNVFAFSQIGNTNVIDGTVTGNGNQVAIAQLGNGNTTNFTQTGNFNVLGVNQ